MYHHVIPNSVWCLLILIQSDTTVLHLFFGFVSHSGPLSPVVLGCVPLYMGTAWSLPLGPFDTVEWWYGGDSAIWPSPCGTQIIFSKKIWVPLSSVRQFKRSFWGPKTLFWPSAKYSQGQLSPVPLWYCSTGKKFDPHFILDFKI